VIEEILKKGSVRAAPLLLGCYLSKQTPQGLIKVKIVETEAYHQNDPASHSFRGITPRTAPMFEAGGRLYIYFTYGMHYAMNIVTGPKGVGEAILVRAGEPLQGLDIMRKNRGINNIQSLASGPGKLAQALGVTSTELSGELLNKSSIFLEPPKVKVKAQDIVISPRVGISKAADQPWRFYIRGNQFVSSRKKL
jgi:DNA-3-methyladenine glycosylase